MSVFKCNIKYNKITGNSYQSTYNKLLAHGFIDKYLNVKTDIATLRKAKSELNELASGRLRQTVNLFDERRLLNNIQLVPNMKLFGMLDYLHKNNITDYQSQIVRDEIDIDEFGDSTTDNLESVQPEPIEKRIYKQLGIKYGRLITNQSLANKLINEFNQLDTGKTLSLQPVNNGWLIKTNFSTDYLYRNNPPVTIPKNDNIPTESNSDFSLNCIKNG